MTKRRVTGKILTWESIGAVDRMDDPGRALVVTGER